MGAGGRLVELEGVVVREWAAAERSLLAVGRALYEIRRGELYLGRYAGWEEYLRDRFSEFSVARAKGLCQAARVAEAIEGDGGAVPAGVSINALVALMPVLLEHGPGEVAWAWGVACERAGSRRLDAGVVRRAMGELGMASRSTWRRGDGPQWWEVTRFVERAGLKLTAYRAGLRGRVLAPGDRERALQLAGMARRIADDLVGLASTDPVDQRLAAVEAGLPAGSVSSPPVCGSHGARVSAGGVCLDCGFALETDQAEVAV